MYHTYLVMTNSSTWENMKSDHIDFISVYPVGYEPFNVALIDNLRKVCLHSNKLRLVFLLIFLGFGNFLMSKKPGRKGDVIGGIINITRVVNFFISKFKKKLSKRNFDFFKYLRNIS